MRSLHHVHYCPTRPGANNTFIDASQAVVVHYVFQCWRDFYVQKIKYGRNGVKDWPDGNFSESPPANDSHWLFKEAQRFTVRDTEFRDFYLRTMAGPAPQPALVH